MTTSNFTAHDFTLRDFTVEVFFRVDETMWDVSKHPLSKLHPSEAVTIGILYGMRGGSFRSFDQWLRRELGEVFPQLPERTRLYRILCRLSQWTQRFLAQPTFFGVLDGFGIEMLHPRRLGWTKHQWAGIGKSNGRWIAGAKLGLCINNQGQIVNWDVAPANASDLEFLPLAHALNEKSILLADQGFLLSKRPKKQYLIRKKGRVRPQNLLICKKGQWPPRRLVETVFAIFTQVFHLKHFTQRQKTGVSMHIAFAIAAYNLCSSWFGKVNLHLARFAL